MTETKEKQSNVGQRGFLLSKWGLLLAAYIITLGFVALFFDKLEGGQLVSILLGASALAGVGPAGHQASNVAERLGSRSPEV